MSGGEGNSITAEVIGVLLSVYNIVSIRKAMLFSQRPLMQVFAEIHSLSKIAHKILEHIEKSMHS